MKLRKVYLLLVCSILFFVTACGGTKTVEKKQETKRIQVKTNISTELEHTSTMNLDYAKEFRVDYYKNGYKLVTVYQDAQYLIVPQNGKVPKDLSNDIVVIKQPTQNIYLVASAVMDMFVTMDALDTLRFSAIDEDGWYNDKVKKRMKSGKLVFAGKYSAPDYELILSEGCDLAIENTMIYHSPKVKEKLEKFSIPVFVDYSSYESHPLGRTEWIKLYGALLNKEETAEKLFNQQKQEYDKIRDKKNTGATVAFFYITSNQVVNVRKSTDYLSKMIEMAGGKYIFSSLGEEEKNASSSVNMQLEEFYAQAKDADYIIYNSTIQGELRNMEEFLQINPLLKKFKAVKEGHVYCTTKNMYQSSMELGTIIHDIHRMLHGEEKEMTYLYPLQ